MSFSPKYGMIMADGTGDARNGKTPPCGVCGAQNAAVAVRRAAVAASSHPVTKNARRRAYCTQNGLRRRLARRFSARESGVPHPSTVCLLPCRAAVSVCRAACCIRPSRGGRRCEHCAGVRRTCRTRNGIAFCRSRHFPPAACLGRVAAVRSGRSRSRCEAAAFWPRAVAVSPKGAHFFETAHLQDDRRMGSIVKY